MGTRNLTIVHKDGKYVLANYGQWDGYPEGQGVTALSFIRDKMDREKFFRGLSKLYQPTQEEYEELFEETTGTKVGENGWVAYDASKEFGVAYPSMTRDTGAKILEFIQDHADADKIPTHNQLSFVADGLFNEWTYVIDFDKNTFEVFKGFGDMKDYDKENERFAFILETTTPEYSEFSKQTYSPVRFITSYPLDNLPDDRTFVEEVDTHPDDEDEEVIFQNDSPIIQS